MSSWLLWIYLILLIGSGAAEEVPFIFSEVQADVASYTPAQFEQTRISSSELAGVPIITHASDDDILEFPVTGGGNAPESTTKVKLRELKRIFDERVDTNNSDVLNKGAILAAKNPGDRTIDQVCSIYKYLKNGEDTTKGWIYVGDRRGLDYYRYANESLNLGERVKCSGIGDCDDFAILMSALIESIGGTTRIILASNNSTGGHAYAEVYLGSLGVQDNHVEEIIKWLEEKYNSDKIYTHIDTDTKDVWLNLDWGDETGNARPGGPFFKGSKHILLSIRDKYQKVPLLPAQISKADKTEVVATTPGKFQEEQEPALLQEVVPEKNKPSQEVPSSGIGGIDTLIDKGIVQNNAGNYDDAISLYNQALGQDPQNYLAWELKGLALRTLGKYEEALSCFERATSIDPARVDAWADKGETFYMSGQYQEAVNSFDKAIQIKPCSDYWRLKAEALMGSGNDKGASDAFVMAQKSVSC
jgi:tetratricopeptide (TPR) repeat protein